MAEARRGLLRQKGCVLPRRTGQLSSLQGMKTVLCGAEGCLLAKHKTHHLPARYYLVSSNNGKVKHGSIRFELAELR